MAQLDRPETVHALKVVRTVKPPLQLQPAENNQLAPGDAIRAQSQSVRPVPFGRDPLPPQLRREAQGVNKGRAGVPVCLIGSHMARLGDMFQKASEDEHHLAAGGGKDCGAVTSPRTGPAARHRALRPLDWPRAAYVQHPHIVPQPGVRVAAKHHNSARWSVQAGRVPAPSGEARAGGDRHVPSQGPRVETVDAVKVTERAAARLGVTAAYDDEEPPTDKRRRVRTPLSRGLTGRARPHKMRQPPVADVRHRVGDGYSWNKNKVLVSLHTSTVHTAA
eukprot:scaffold12953_cov96-Isochrysis_galbana.AAC.2